MSTHQTSGKHRPMPYPLRIPQDLRQLLEKSAEKNQRSLNGEIVFQLKTKLQGEAT